MVGVSRGGQVEWWVYLEKSRWNGVVVVVGVSRGGQVERWVYLEEGRWNSWVYLEEGRWKGGLCLSPTVSLGRARRTWVCLSPAVSRGGQKAGRVVVSEPRCFKMAATRRRLWTSSGSRNQSSSTKRALSPRKTHNFLAPPNNI